MKKRNEKRKTAAEKDKKKGKWQEAKCRLQVVVLKIEVEKKKVPKKVRKENEYSDYGRDSASEKMPTASSRWRQKG